MNIKTIGVFVLLALLSLSVVSAADMGTVLKVSKAKLNGLDLSESKLHSFTRGSDLNLELTVEGLEDFQNAELTASIAGYENNDRDDGLNAVQVFSVRKGITQTRTLRLRLPETLDAGEYTVSLAFNSRNADALRYSYKIDVSVPEHAVRVKELLVTPAQKVRAGEAVLVKARLANRGLSNEDVRIEASVETLATRQASYLSIKSGEERTTEELFLPVDACATAGKHSINVKVSFNDLRDSSTASYDVEVLPGDCDGAGASSSKGSTRSLLENSLLVLVVLVLIVALIVGLSKLRSGDEE